MDKIKGKKEYLEYFLKIEELNKNLRQDLYKSSIEMANSMKIFFEYENLNYKDINVLHKEIFKNPIEIYEYLEKSEEYVNLVNSVFEGKSQKEDYILNLKKFYLKFVKEYINIIYSMGFKNIYENYIDIIERLNKIFEDIMIPMTFFINESSIKSQENFKYINTEEKFLNKINDINNNMNILYEYSIENQKNTLLEINKFIDYTFDYYENIFKELVNVIFDLGNNLNKRRIKYNFEDYYYDLKESILLSLKEYNKFDDFTKYYTETKDKLKDFTMDNRDLKINRLEEELKRINREIEYLKKLKD